MEASTPVTNISPTQNTPVQKDQGIISHVAASIAYTVASESLALVAIAYHTICVALKVLPVTVHQITGMLPESLTWSRLYHDHVIPTSKAIETVFMAPYEAFTSEDRIASFRATVAGIFALSVQSQSIVSAAAKDVRDLSLRTSDADSRDEMGLSRLEKIVNFTKAHPVIIALPLLVGLGVAIGVTLPYLSSYLQQQRAEWECKLVNGEYASAGSKGGICVIDPDAFKPLENDKSGSYLNLVSGANMEEFSVSECFSYQKKKLIAGWHATTVEDSNFYCAIKRFGALARKPCNFFDSQCSQKLYQSGSATSMGLYCIDPELRLPSFKQFLEDAITRNQSPYHGGCERS